MKRFKIIPIVLASLLLFPACSKHISSKKQESSPAPSSEPAISSSQSSNNPSSSNASSSNSQGPNSNASGVPDVPTNMVPLASAIESFKSASKYTLVFAQGEAGQQELPIGETGRKTSTSFEYSWCSQTDYYNQYWRNFRYGEGQVKLVYADLLEMVNCAASEFEGNFKTYLSPLIPTATSYQIDAQTGLITIYYGDSNDAPAYTFGGYDADNEQYYVVENGEEPNTYIGDYLNTEYKPNEAHGIEETILSNIDLFSYNATSKEFECSNAGAFASYFNDNVPTKVSISLDEDGNLAKFDAPLTNGHFIISFKNIGGVSEFENMPVVSRIGCEQHQFFTYEVLEGGHRLCCSLCHKYLTKLEPHEDNNAYHVCKKCREITGLQPYDDSDFIRDANASNKYDKYHFILYKTSADNKLFDLEGGWHSELERIGYAYDSDYIQTEYYYDRNASIFIAVDVNENPSYIFDDSCLQVITQNVYFYKNVTVSGEYGNYNIGGQTLSEYIDSVTPTKSLVAYRIFHEHNQQRREVEAPINACETRVDEICSRCGELLSYDMKFNHNWSFIIYSADQIKAACPDADVDNAIEDNNLNLFFKAECSKCHKVVYVGMNNDSNHSLTHADNYTSYYLFFGNKNEGYNESPFGHIFDSNGVCQICGGQKGQAGNISFFYNDYDESLNHYDVNYTFSNGEHIDTFDVQISIQGNITISTYPLYDKENQVIGTLVTKDVYGSVYYFSVEDLENHKFEFTSSHDFGANPDF